MSAVLSSTAANRLLVSRVRPHSRDLSAIPFKPKGESNRPAHYVNLPNSHSREIGGTPECVRGGVFGLSTACRPRSDHVAGERASEVPAGHHPHVVADVATKFGLVSIESTHRTRGHNGRAGGAPHSLHLSCRAVDFRVRARSRGVMAYLRSRPEVGGLKIYRTGIIHIDNGERRRLVRM